MELFEQLNTFFGTYKEIATAFYSFFGFLSALVGVAFIIFRVINHKKIDRDKKDSDMLERIKDLEIEMNHINHPETGRIHKTMRLCEKLVDHSIKTREIAAEAKGLVNNKF